MKKLFLIVFLIIGISVFCEDQKISIQIQTDTSRDINLQIIQIQNGLTYDKVDSIVVHDGDTLYLDINCYPPIIGKHIGVRVNGIDTPELHDQRLEIKALSEKARDYLKGKIAKAKIIQIQNPKRDKYFRILADVIIDGININKEMISLGLAKEYHGEKKEW
jgi:endonuclease YncB( thermonuclease family)